MNLDVDILQPGNIYQAPALGQVPRPCVLLASAEFCAESGRSAHSRQGPDLATVASRGSGNKNRRSPYSGQALGPGFFFKGTLKIYTV